MKEMPADFDPQAYGRNCALQQAEMLTRLAEMGMQLAESAGARILGGQAPEAQPAAAAAPAEALAGLAAPAGDPGLAFVRYAHLVRHTLAQRARAVRDMCARDGGREARRTRHREQVETMIDGLVWGDVEDRDRAAALDMQVNQAFADLYGDREDPVEDRPVGSVVTGLVCGLGLARKWSRRARHRVSRPRPGRPGGSAEEIAAERARRRAAVTARVELAIDELAEPALAADIRAGLAVRLQEPDVERLIDTESTATAVVRLCRSLGFDIEGNLDIPLDPAVPPDSS
ncbi:hypothetical protein E9232_006090 [Inquilinus ginsengisoli]|uniref:Uncharacterized protein n=1 Tax=Inquilinus ginsengisoli TaxID=363840 RepID=A0ABU1K172_9PROT|nr:hypothetical protein [Inquilinus ginsengisoli]MDR6293539.1 hypothetical protein [Inquilinus ginsengisoli]